MTASKTILFDRRKIDPLETDAFEVMRDHGWTWDDYTYVSSGFGLVGFVDDTIVFYGCRGGSTLPAGAREIEEDTFRP